MAKKIKRGRKRIITGTVARDRARDKDAYQLYLRTYDRYEKKLNKIGKKMKEKRISEGDFYDTYVSVFNEQSIAIQKKSIKRHTSVVKEMVERQAFNVTREQARTWLNIRNKQLGLDEAQLSSADIFMVQSEAHEEIESMREESRKMGEALAKGEFDKYDLENLLKQMNINKDEIDSYTIARIVGVMIWGSEV